MFNRTVPLCFRRRETGGPQGQYNGNGNEQSGENFESADTVRTEGYKFRDGKDYRAHRREVWKETYGRVCGLAKKTDRKFIK